MSTAPMPLLGRLPLLTLVFLGTALSLGAVVRVGLLSDPKLRAVEDLVLVGLQSRPELEFLERGQLALLSDELSLDQTLSRAGWTGCDALVLLNTFAGRPGDKPDLIVRVVSTRDLKITGLWIYPLLAQEPEKLAARLVDRVGPLLADTASPAPRRVVSLALLRADEPRLSRLAEPATYQLAAALAAYPGLALVERWNVRDPAFEQWLCQTQPADLRPPDLLLNGALAASDRGVGLRLELNDGTRDFFSESGDLGPAILAAARAVGDASQVPPPPARQEIARHETDARWFWKWSAFTHAAASADTALFLGSRTSETAYIRALARLRPSRGFTSNRPYTDTPDEETFSRALYGLECLLRIPEPDRTLPLRERIAHLRYLEQAAEWTGRLLEGLYFSRETLPGAPGERALFCRLAAELTERAWDCYFGLKTHCRDHGSTIEHIDGYGTNLTLPLILLKYAAFSEPDAPRLANLYAACLSEVVRRQNDNDDVLGRLANARLGHRAWFLDWDGLPPDLAARAQAQAILLDHPEPAVRLLAGLMPLLRRSSEHPQYRALLAVWLDDLAHRWTAEQDFFLAPQPISLPRTLLSYSRLLLFEQKELLGETLPAAEWHRFYSLLAEKAPARFTARRELSMLNSIRGAEVDTAALLRPGAEPNSNSPTLSAERRARTFALLLEARPTDPEDARRLASEAAAPRRDAWRARLVSAEADRPAPRLVFDPAPRTLGRVASADGGPADRLQFEGPRALPVAVTRDEAGHLWLLFCESRGRESTLIWRELDPRATNLVREIRLEHSRDYFLDPTHHVLHVRSGRIYTALRSGLHTIDLDTRSSRLAELPDLRDARVWAGGDRVWLSGAPGTIYEYQEATGTLALVSSAMRVPARNRLDARSAYEVTALFQHGAGWYAWIDDQVLHQWDPATRDWREIYTTRRHWSPGQSYPADLLFAAIGSGLDAGRSQEGLFRLLGSDPALGGHFRGKFDSRYSPDELPQNWSSAAYLDHRVWTFHADHRGTYLVSKRRDSGQLERLLLGKRPYTGLHAFDTGFLFVDEATKTLHHLPRERLDPACSPPDPPSPPPPPAGDAVPSASPLRVFRSDSGQILEAGILGYFGDSVTLRRGDGQVVTVAFARFSSEDLAYLREDRTRRAATPARP